MRQKSLVGMCRLLFVLLGVVLLLGGCSHVALTSANVRSLARTAARAAGPAPDDIAILSVAVSHAGDVMVHARGTVVDAGDAADAPAGLVRRLDEAVFSKTSARQVTVLWGETASPYVSVTYDRAAWRQARAAIADAPASRVAVIRLFRDASGYAWLDRAVWKEATSSDGAYTAAELPMRNASR